MTFFLVNRTVYLRTLTNTGNLLIATLRNTQQEVGVWKLSGHAEGILLMYLITLLCCSQLSWKQYMFYLNTVNTVHLCPLSRSNRERPAVTLDQTSVFFISSVTVAVNLLRIWNSAFIHLVLTKYRC